MNYLLVERKTVHQLPLLVPILIFLFTIGLSLIDSALPGIAIVRYLRYVFLFVMMYTLYHAFRSHISIRKVFNWYMAFSVIAAITMILDVRQSAIGRSFGIAGIVFNDILVGANIMAFGYVLAGSGRF